MAMSGKLRSVQVVRAVAACGVLLCHTAGWSLGAAGVDLFFVISGFIIGTVMPGRDARSFFADRLRRIYPIYFVACCRGRSSEPCSPPSRWTGWRRA